MNNCNQYGDYKICTVKKLSNGDLQWSKHYSVMEIWHDIDNLRWRLLSSTDRTLYCNELVLDIDPEINETKEDVFLKFTNIYHDLKRRNINFKAYNTGGNGYHIHILIRKLALMNKSQRANYRRNIIDYYNCDKMKASDNMMILLEGEPNRKTGIKKQEVKL